MKKRIFICGFLFYSFLLTAQSGGNNTYDFLNLTNSARVASLGGQQISLADGDLDMVFHNPSLLSKEMDNHIVLNYINYFAEINYGYVSMARNFEKPYTIAAGIHYIYYGEMIQADESGYKKGTFRAADYALNLYYARPIIDSLLFFGINLKPLFSDYENYNSIGIATDIGLSYINTEHLFTAALVVKNIGFQIKKYYPEHPREPLPFEIQVGISKKLRHAPFRFSVLAQQLQEYDLMYKTERDNENSVDLLTGEPVKEDKLGDFADNLMRHMIFGVEFLPGRNFNFRLGYNYKRRVEMRLEETPAMVGFSWGFGIHIKKININYGRSTYHISRGTNHISVAVNLSELGLKL